MNHSVSMKRDLTQNLLSRDSLAKHHNSCARALLCIISRVHRGFGSLHVALQLNWILVAALEDYHAELPDGSRNKKANAMYFHRCAKLLQVCLSSLKHKGQMMIGHALWEPSGEDAQLSASLAVGVAHAGAISGAAPEVFLSGEEPDVIR